jgi:hypothetical protein
VDQKHLFLSPASIARFAHASHRMGSDPLPYRLLSLLCAEAETTARLRCSVDELAGQVRADPAEVRRALGLLAQNNYLTMEPEAEGSIEFTFPFEPARLRPRTACRVQGLGAAPTSHPH